jgi:hypothetical protein
MEKSHRKEKRRPLISGFILLGLGLLLLLGMYDIIPVENSWPLLIILAGFALIVGAVTRRSPKAHSNQSSDQT